jgi:hypothetical protein
MSLDVALPTVARRSRWAGLGAFIGTELRVQLHEVLSIATSVIVQAVFLVFVAVLARQYLSYTLIGAVVFSTFQIGQRVQNESAWIRIDHKLHELYHASPMTPEAYFLGMSVGILLAYCLPIVVLFVAAAVLVPLTVSSAAVLLGVLAAEFVFIFPAALRPWALLLPTASGAALAEHAAGILALPLAWELIAGLSLPVAAILSFVGAVYWARRISRAP